MRPYSYFVFPQTRLPEPPRIGQRVRIEGQPGLYVVLHIDMKRAAADLMLTSGNHQVEHRVPFFAIEPVPDTSAAKVETEEKDKGKALRS